MKKAEQEISPSNKISVIVFSNDKHDFWEIDSGGHRYFSIAPKGSDVPAGAQIKPNFFLKLYGYKVWPINVRVQELAAALTRAEAAAIAAGNANPDDGGTCNFDTPMIELKGWTPEEIQAVKFISGIEIGEAYNSRYWKGCRPVGTSRWGQAARRTRMAEAAHKSLKAEAAGYEVSMYYQMD